jgi:hypothetical protein
MARDAFVLSFSSWQKAVDIRKENPKIPIIVIAAPSC